jgi:hypothetical protein
LDDRSLLLSLRQQPGWQVLERLAGERRDRTLANLAHDLAERKEGTVPPEELQYLRGFLAGMKFLLKQPDLEARKFERALKGDVSA